MLNTIGLLLVIGFLFFLEALREIRTAHRKANANDALRCAASTVSGASWGGTWAGRAQDGTGSTAVINRIRSGKK